MDTISIPQMVKGFVPMLARARQIQLLVCGFDGEIVELGTLGSMAHQPQDLQVMTSGRKVSTR